MIDRFVIWDERMHDEHAWWGKMELAVVLGVAGGLLLWAANR